MLFNKNAVFNTFFKFKIFEAIFVLLSELLLFFLKIIKNYISIYCLKLN